MLSDLGAARRVLPQRSGAAALGSATARPAPAPEGRNRHRLGAAALTSIATAPRQETETFSRKAGSAFPPTEGRAGQGGARAGLAQPRLRALAITRAEATEKQQDTAPVPALLPWRQGQLSRECKVDRY